MGGHPLRIIQSASLAREGKASLSEILSQLQGNAPDDALVRASLNSLTEAQEGMLAILAALRGKSLPEKHLAALSQSRDVQQDLRALMSMGLVQAHSPRYSLAGSLPDALGAAWDLSSWEDVLINYFVNWLAEQPSQMLVDEASDALLLAVKKAGERNRWREVVQIGRVLERILILKKRWQAWLDVLELIMQAARMLRNRKIEAWALHQLGTRAACLGFGEPARGFLTQALRIRQAIGDQAGMMLTRHNMSVFFKIPVPPKSGKSGCRRWMAYGAAGVGGMVALGVAAIAVIWFWDYIKPTPAPPPVVVTRVVSATPLPATATSPPTRTPPNTATNTPTRTPSDTPTASVTPSNTPKPVTVDFWSADDTILAGDCTYLQWDVRFANRVYLDGSEVDSSDSDSACPDRTTTYTLYVESDSGTAERQVTVKVIAPYPPPGHSPSIPVCGYPWSYANGATYYDPRMVCSWKVDICYQPGSGCGKAAADAWCDLYTPFSAALSWEIGSPQYPTRYIGSRENCYGLSCKSFSSITCDYTR